MNTDKRDLLILAIVGVYLLVTMAVGVWGEYTSEVTLRECMSQCGPQHTHPEGDTE